jgi:hypothetical protein
MDLKYYENKVIFVYTWEQLMKLLSRCIAKVQITQEQIMW